MITKTKSTYLNICQKAGAAVNAPTHKQANIFMFVLGVGLLSGGLTELASAQGGSRVTNTGTSPTVYNDARITDSINIILTYIEGSFGALVMVASGLGAIISAAFGQYRAALGLLVVAVGAFILRSLVGTFFNDANIQQ